MRIVIADCSVIYTGRGDTKMLRAVRSIIIKSDGAVSIHNDFGNKPLNYMGAKSTVFSESSIGDVLIWRFENRKENLTVRIHSVISDTSHDLDLNDQGLIRDGTENHLQEWLAENPQALGEGYTLVAREAQTGNGPVDLLMKDAEGIHVAVEVKRVAMLGAVGQVLRYVDALNETGEYGVVRGLIAALDVRPNTVKLADKKGISYVTVDAAWNGRETVVEAIPITKHAEPEQAQNELFGELKTGT